jgi:hypothetical protein
MANADSYFYEGVVLSPFYDKLTLLLWPDWVHPNFITTLGGLFALASVVAVDADSLGWATLLFTVYHMCDKISSRPHSSACSSRV